VDSEEWVGSEAKEELVVKEESAAREGSEETEDLAVKAGSGATEEPAETEGLAATEVTAVMEDLEEWVGSEVLEVVGAEEEEAAVHPESCRSPSLAQSSNPGSTPKTNSSQASAREPRSASTARSG
jgi:hypothetical protein